MFHAISGGVGAYRQLAEALSENASLRGVTALGRLPGEVPLDDVKRMAAGYAEQIADDSAGRGVGLLGWCMGGLLAHETASILSCRSIPIMFVALLDTNLVVTKDPARAPWLKKMFWSSLGGIALGPKWSSVEFEHVTLGRTDEEKRAVLKSAVEIASEERINFDVLFSVFSANWAATQNYVPTPYAGKVDFFAASDSEYGDAAEQWKRHSGGEVFVHQLSGSHFSILQYPSVDTIADWVRSSIRSNT
ncbi:UNVERIFIED_ORG: thioesterase domain-containing protein [Burkholderia contaminans]|nr:thioesterase domain-containing protein [Burkholderia contaminans]